MSTKLHGAGFTLDDDGLAQLALFARNDDCLDIFVPSDLRQMTAEIQQLRAAISLVRGIIVEGAAVGFNPLTGGDWADRLFRSQADTFEALHGKRQSPALSAGKSQ